MCSKQCDDAMSVMIALKHMSNDDDQVYTPTASGRFQTALRAGGVAMQQLSRNFGEFYNAFGSALRAPAEFDKQIESFGRIFPGDISAQGARK